MIFLLLIAICDPSIAASTQCQCNRLRNVCDNSKTLIAATLVRVEHQYRNHSIFGNHVIYKLSNVTVINDKLLKERVVLTNARVVLTNATSCKWPTLENGVKYLFGGRGYEQYLYVGKCGVIKRWDTVQHRINGLNSETTSCVMELLRKIRKYEKPRKTYIKPFPLLFPTVTVQ